jgi:hypothetical protein
MFEQIPLLFPAVVQMFRSPSFLKSQRSSRLTDQHLTTEISRSNASSFWALHPMYLFLL